MFAFALAGLLTAVIDDVRGGGERRSGRSRSVTVLLAGFGLGALQGALVAEYGPIDLTAAAIAVMDAVSLRRSALYRRRRHSAAILALVFLASFALGTLAAGIFVLTKA